MPELVPTRKSALTAAQFDQLADVPPEVEWLANITNPKTRRAYKTDVAEFFAFAGLKSSAELRDVTRAHVIAWRKDLEARQLADTSIRRKLSALSSLFDYLCERNAVLGNPVDGVKRPMANGNEGATPALGDSQARKLLDAPPEDTLKGKRDRAILATLLYHGIRREELAPEIDAATGGSRDLKSMGLERLSRENFKQRVFSSEGFRTWSSPRR